MIGLKVNNEWVDLLPRQKVSFEIINPIFVTDSIPGTITMPFQIDLRSRNNRLILGWPDQVSNSEKSDNITNVELFINGSLYKVGVLKYRGQRGGIGQYNFQSDSGDFNNLSEGVKLRAIDLGQSILDENVINGFYPDYDYALFPVANSKFYGDKNENYGGVINHFDAGSFSENSYENSVHTRVPFPYLIGIFKKVLGVYGYSPSISSGWMDEEDTLRTVIMNNYSLDKIEYGINVFEDVINWSDHMPDMTVNQLILAVKKMFGLSMIFNAKTKTVDIVKLDDVITNVMANPAEYVDWTGKAFRDYEDAPVDYNGYKMTMEQDSTDDSLESLGNDWLEYRVDSGRDEITCTGAPLHMTGGMPIITQSGTSPAFETGVNLHPFRLMYYKGIVNNIPQGDYAGTNIDLRWQGANGLYFKNYKNWLDFLAAGIPVKRKLNLNLVDIYNLTPTKPVMIDYVKYFWRKVSFGVGNKGIDVSTVDLVKV